MLSKLVIVADLQHLKLFAIEQDPIGRKSLELLLSSDSLDIHQKVSEKVSDRKGNFQNSWGSGSGEDHHIAEEEELRRIKELVQQISTVLQEHEYESWCFAAPKAINRQIIELLTPDIKNTLTVNLLLDLTKIPADQLLEHFTK